MPSYLLWLIVMLVGLFLSLALYQTMIFEFKFIGITLMLL